MYRNLTYTKTKDMSREEWERMRQSLKTIGGSDAAALLGLNEYESPYSLWARLSGKVIPEDISGKESVRLGVDLEDYVAKRWMEATGKKLKRCNAVIRNPDYPFAHADVDRLVIGEDAGFEAKTTTSWEIAQQCREGKFPDRFYTQCTHYLLVTGCKRWYLAILVFGVGFFHFVIERDDAEIRALADAERAFYENVLNDTPPSLDGSEATTEALKAIHPRSVENTTADLSLVGYHVSTLVALDKQIAELEKLREEHANHIKDFMGANEKGIYGNTTVTWKSSTRKTFDKKTYEADYGKIADKYYKTSEARTFKVTIKEK